MNERGGRELNGASQMALNEARSRLFKNLPFLTDPQPSPPPLSLREGDWGKAGGPPTPSRKMAGTPGPQIKYIPSFAGAVKFNRPPLHTLRGGGRLNFLYLLVKNSGASVGRRAEQNKLVYKF